MLYQIAKRDGFKYKIMFSLSFLFLIFQSLTLVFLENQFNFFCFTMYGKNILSQPFAKYAFRKIYFSWSTNLVPGSNPYF